MNRLIYNHSYIPKAENSPSGQFLQNIIKNEQKSGDYFLRNLSTTSDQSL